MTTRRWGLKRLNMIVQRLIPVTDNVECELYLVSNSNQTMDSRGCFDLVVRSIDRKLATRSEIVARQSNLRRNFNVTRHAVQRQIAT